MSTCQKCQTEEATQLLYPVFAESRDISARVPVEMCNGCASKALQSGEYERDEETAPVRTLAVESMSQIEAGTKFYLDQLEPLVNGKIIGLVSDRPDTTRPVRSSTAPRPAA